MLAVGRGGDAVGELFVVGDAGVDEHRHAGLALVDAKAQALEHRVSVVVARVDLAEGPVDAALARLVGITAARADLVTVLVVGEAATDAGVEPGAGEGSAVLDIGGAAEAQPPIGVEAGEAGLDALAQGG